MDAGPQLFSVCEMNVSGPIRLAGGIFASGTLGVGCAKGLCDALAPALGAANAVLLAKAAGPLLSF